MTNLRPGSFALVLIAALTLLSATEGHAGLKQDGARCKKDAQCASHDCCGGVCVRTSTDNNNCGGCGSVCSEAADCQEGVCRCLPTRQDICGSACTNVLWDDDNCGACGNACAENQGCFLGTCGCPDASQLWCNGQCIEGTTDPNNCGNCGVVCPAGQGCVGGQCQAPCGPCHELVNNVCVPLDPTANCCEWNGAAHTCAPGEQCAAWGCCSAGHTVCLGNGSAECCYNGLVCEAGRCCVPDSMPGCPGGTACCSYGD
jgi:hypothetical protein